MFSERDAIRAARDVILAAPLEFILITTTYDEHGAPVLNVSFDQTRLLDAVREKLFAPILEN
jgi:hypothetical protein